MNPPVNPPLPQAPPNVPHRTYQVEKLTGPNYLVWRVRMEMILQRADAWAILTGTEVDPGRADPAAQANWRARDLAAWMEIILHLGDPQLQMLRTFNTSNQIWPLLRSTYEHTDLISQVTILKKLMNLNMVDTQLATPFLDEWITLLDDAAISGLLIPLKTFKPCFSLPHFRQHG